MKTPKVKQIIIRERIGGKPSVALVAMCDGLEAQDARDDFEVDMDTYGDVSSRKDMCYGCAATCAAIQLLPEVDRIALVEWSGCATVRITELTLDRADLDDFESAIDDARKGCLDELFLYCCSFDSMPEGLDPPGFHLENNDWREQIPTVRAYAAYLNDQGY